VEHVLCPACGTPNEGDRKFCGECGTALAQTCPSCGTPNPPTVKFCGECGAALSAQATEASIAPSAPAAARRLVSVLFADLVGFTSASEERDAEDTRELLTRYFQTARTVIERYGGTVEKFIGDAVMAVWGTPTATEDDAERAVRAALDLIAAVPQLDPELNARAGVLTGEVAVTVGAEGQGMVAGDLVNTSSRVQSLAEPGTVLVGESTRRATEAAIAYADAGSHELKGKTESVPLWRALRVVAGKGGAMRASSLEAPFVGRARDLRLVKELFHAAAEEGKATLVGVVGVAGIGKTRLSWEFEKYIDGLAHDVWWHRGRCLSYGEGVAYWALAEMVRSRCDIVEDEGLESALAKLHVAVEKYIFDPEEQRWVEPRLAHLLGLAEGTPGDQENLFSAWRILFERLAERNPVLLVFEDMQWADAGLLDFLEYLLDWSRNHPLFVLALARPELAEKRPSWGAGKRSFTSLYLEPLSAQAMDELLSGLVPGLPEDLRQRILERAEGVPLYAVETVRMLLDRGLLVHEDDVYRPTGPVEALEVPETLHALIAARLDSLTTEERQLVQDGSVLGKTFTKPGLLALANKTQAEVEPLLGSLLRKEILAVQADPQSPERGQYTFLQEIVRRVAYETLAKRERRAKHLAAAQFLETVPGAEEDELAEVVAAHYLDAYSAAPDAEDAAAIRDKARAMVIRAAERAASLAANAEAQRSFERAVELTDDAFAQAELHERAGVMAQTGGRAEQGSVHFERAIALFEEGGATHPAARVSARLAEVMWSRGRIEHGLEMMDRSLQVLSREEPDADLAALAAQVGRFSFFAGNFEHGLQRIETALDIAEALALPEVLSQALNTKSIILVARGRRNEGLVLLKHALEVALDNDKPTAALRAYMNLADALGHVDRYEESARAARDGLALARRVGNREWEWNLLGQQYGLFALGGWDEVLDMTSQLPDETWSAARQAYGAVVSVAATVNAHRGRLDEVERIVALCSEMADSADVQERGSFNLGRASLLLMSGHTAEAMRAAEEALAAREEMGMTQEYVKQAFAVAGEAALILGELEKVEELIALVDKLPPGKSSQFLQAQAARLRSGLAQQRGETDEAERLAKRATAMFREIAMPFFLAVVELEHAEWLAGQGRADEATPLLAEANEIFERLEATPWLERVERVGGAARVLA
jgi:class 3 adenylate cyclase/tetratricopeptide (TPR) repeat protein